MYFEPLKMHLCLHFLWISKVHTEIFFFQIVIEYVSCFVLFFLLSLVSV